MLNRRLFLIGSGVATGFTLSPSWLNASEPPKDKTNSKIVNFASTTTFSPREDEYIPPSLKGGGGRTQSTFMDKVLAVRAVKPLPEPQDKSFDIAVVDVSGSNLARESKTSFNRFIGTLKSKDVIAFAGNAKKFEGSALQLHRDVYGTDGLQPNENEDQFILNLKKLDLHNGTDFESAGIKLIEVIEQRIAKGEDPNDLKVAFITDAKQGHPMSHNTQKRLASYGLKMITLIDAADGQKVDNPVTPNLYGRPQRINQILRQC